MSFIIDVLAFKVRAQSFCLTIVKLTYHFQGQPESANDPQLAHLPLYDDCEMFKRHTVNARLSFLRILLNTTKSTLDELLRPETTRKCNIIANLLASLSKDLEEHPDVAERLQEIKTSFDATVNEIKFALDL